MTLPKVSNVSGAAFWPVGQTDGPAAERETAAVRLERFIRQLEAEGYTDAEIEGAFQVIVHDEFMGR